METRKNQPFCNTAEIVKKLKVVRRYQSTGWNGFTNPQTFINLQDAVQAEAKFLDSFWIGERNAYTHRTLDLKKFYRWNCEQAFYDLSQEDQDYAASRTKKYNLGGKSVLRLSKYEVFHRREEILQELQHEIFCLYHDWHFVTQGWTAY